MDSGYALQQRTRPQTIGYALVDSPVAQCAWIVEKLRAWSDPSLALPQSRMLDMVSTYWLTATGASAARLYWESRERVSAWFTDDIDDTVDVPTGCTVFPADNPRPSRRWAQRRFTDIRYWSELVGVVDGRDDVSAAGELLRQRGEGVARSAEAWREHDQRVCAVRRPGVDVAVGRGGAESLCGHEVVQALGLQEESGFFSGGVGRSCARAPAGRVVQGWVPCWPRSVVGLCSGTR